MTSGVGVVTYAKSRAESAQDGKNDSLGKSVAAFEEKGATRAANASTRAIPGANLMVFLLLLFERGECGAGHAGAVAASGLRISLPV